MAMVAIAIGISPQGQSVIDAWKGSQRRVVESLDRGIDQVLEEAAALIQSDFLSGKAGGGKGGNTPVGLRSGALRQDITTNRLGPLRGDVGTTSRTKDYARVILGPDTSTLKPVNANHLWVPIADNLNPSMIPRMTPREAMSIRMPNGKRALRFFKSKKGNLVAFLPGDLVADDVGAALGLVGGDSRTAINVGKRYKSGAKKGKVKGRLLFVLKKQVVVVGTDALAKGINSMSARASQILSAALAEALP